MENDEFVIPEQYRKMSVTELDAEANKMLKEIQQGKRIIWDKKKAAQGKNEIVFMLSSKNSLRFWTTSGSFFVSYRDCKVRKENKYR